jgi:hypothetical protein
MARQGGAESSSGARMSTQVEPLDEHPGSASSQFVDRRVLGNERERSVLPGAMSLWGGARVLLRCATLATK